MMGMGIPNRYKRIDLMDGSPSSDCLPILNKPGSRRLWAKVEIRTTMDSRRREFSGLPPGCDPSPSSGRMREPAARRPLMSPVDPPDVRTHPIGRRRGRTPGGAECGGLSPRWRYRKNGDDDCMAEAEHEADPCWPPFAEKQTRPGSGSAAPCRSLQVATPRTRRRQLTK